ncbi:MAG: S41 family peptidase, partial [Flavobacterium sp.]
MLRKIGLLFLLLISIKINSFSQACNCSAQLDYAIQKIEANYAGYADKVTAVTSIKYQELNSFYRKKAAAENNADSCLQLIREWTKFFKDGHIQVAKKSNTATSGKTPLPVGEQFYFKNVGDQTNLIRIASFNHVYKKVIDSIIKANYTKITSTKYLLIDLRGNGGGSDVSYNELMPFIYTNPISITGNAKLSTPDNIAKYEVMVNDVNYPRETREYAKRTVDNLRAIPGKFLEGSDDTFTLKEVLPYPALVGILIDKKCASTTEQFLLAAKQSSKAVF